MEARFADAWMRQNFKRGDPQGDYSSEIVKSSVYSSGELSSLGRHVERAEKGAILPALALA